MSITNSDLIERLRVQAKKGPQEFLQTVVDPLQRAQYAELDPELPDEYRRLRSLAHDQKDGADCLLQGALGIFLFAYHAERWQLTPQDDESSVTGPGAVGMPQSEDIREPQQLGAPHFHEAYVQWALADGETQSFLYELYLVPSDWRHGALSLHEVGITSFILKLHKYDRALKIVKPWFFDDKEIERQTKEYAETYQRLHASLPYNTPRIDDSGPRCVVMEFVEGKTLRHYFRRELSGRGDAKARKDKSESLRQLRAILVELCKLLRECATLNPPIYHGDLSSTNILIEDGSQRLHLIDFGVNYLLTRRVGNVDQYRERTMTVDPEIMGKHAFAEASILGDVYSIGVVCAEGLLGHDFEAEDIQILLDRIYKQYLGLGAVLDDLLDPEPARRIPNAEPGPKLYDELSHRIQMELEFAARGVEEDSKPFARAVDRVLGILVAPELKDLWRLWRDRSRRGNAIPAPQSRVPPLAVSNYDLLDLALIPVFLNTLIVTWFLERILSVDGILRGDFGNLAALLPNLAGWSVAVSGSIITTKYYLGIFAGLSTSGMPGWSWLTTRLCAFTIWGPIFYAFFVDSRAWPICAALGLTVVVINNYVWYLVGCNAKAKIAASDMRVSPYMDQTIEYLQEWWMTAGVFVLFMYIVAALLSRHVLVDVGFYAVAVAFGANAKMYYINCTRDAPLVRTGLHRLTRGYKRAMMEIRPPFGQPVRQNSTDAQEAVSDVVRTNLP